MINQNERSRYLQWKLHQKYLRAEAHPMHESEPWHIEPRHVESWPSYVRGQDSIDVRIARRERELGIDGPLPRALTRAELRDANIARLERELGIGDA